jgi:hypothetical protein
MDHRAVIEELGGYEAVAKGLGCHRARVSHWKSNGIPIARWPALIAMAKQAGVALTFEALLAGRSAEGTVAPLAASGCRA